MIPSTGEDALPALDADLHLPRPGTAVLTVAGEVDTITAAHLGVALGRLLDEPADVLVVDLTGITFLASSGLAVLIQAASRADGTGRRLRLVASGRQVRRPLEITGTDQLFDLHDDRASAGIAESGAPGQPGADRD
ncbi:STAS domain-containing protein [Pseudonocardia saturnea]